MYQFCFNDCIPNTASQHALIDCLQNSLKEYNEVKKAYPNEIDGVVTSVSIADFLLNAPDYSLAKCVSEMPDKDMRTLAYSLFTKHPIEQYYAEIDEDDLLQKEYSLTIAGTAHTAINPVIVSSNNGVLFSLGLHNDLRKNVLTVTSNTTATVDVNNLFGLDANTTFIKGLIKQSLTDKLANFDKLIEMLSRAPKEKDKVQLKPHFSTRFKKGFDELSSQVQVSILEHFKAAMKRNGVTPLFSDNDLVKDVTPERVPFKVFELRIFKPVHIRVYFYEGTNRTYLAMVEKKPAGKKQDIHIDTSTSIISQLITLDN